MLGGDFGARNLVKARHIVYEPVPSKVHELLLNIGVSLICLSFIVLYSLFMYSDVAPPSQVNGGLVLSI